MKQISVSEINRLANLQNEVLPLRPKSFGAWASSIIKYTSACMAAMKQQEAVGKMSEVPASIRSCHSFLQKEYQTWTSVINQRARAK